MAERVKGRDDACGHDIDEAQERGGQERERERERERVNMLGFHRVAL